MSFRLSKDPSTRQLHAVNTLRRRPQKMRKSAVRARLAHNGCRRNVTALCAASAPLAGRRKPPILPAPPNEQRANEPMALLRTAALLAALMPLLAPISPAGADPQDPDLIFRKSTTFKFLTPNDKLAVYGIDDPIVEGVACHYTTPEKGGVSGALGLAEQTSDVSLSCAQYGPIGSRRNSRKATWCSGRNDRSSSRKCRSSGDATPGGIFWCT